MGGLTMLELIWGAHTMIYNVLPGEVIDMSI